MGKFVYLGKDQETDPLRSGQCDILVIDDYVVYIPGANGMCDIQLFRQRGQLTISIENKVQWQIQDCVAWPIKNPKTYKNRLWEQYFGPILFDPMILW